MLLYLEWCEFIKRRTSATIVTYRRGLERFLSSNPDISDFATLTNWQLDEWRASLAKQGKAGKTINNYADCVIGCIRYLKVHRKLPVALDFDALDRAEEEEADTVVYTQAEVALALNACRGPRDDLILSLAFQSGLRLTEMSTLKVENIDGLAITVVGKRRKRRRTFIREDTRKKLDRWLTLNDITEGYVFPSPTKWDGHLNRQHIQDTVQIVFERAGVKKRGHPHALRHTWFTTMLDNGAPLMDTAIMGGHEDPKTTKRYYHASPKRHSEIHRNFIPTAEQLKSGLDTVDNRPQEMY